MIGHFAGSKIGRELVQPRVNSCGIHLTVILIERDVVWWSVAGAGTGVEDVVASGRTGSDLAART